MSRFSTFILVLFFVSTAIAQDKSNRQGTLIVLNKQDNTASLINVSNGQTLALVPTGNGPHEGAVSPDGELAVVGDYGGQSAGNSLTVIDIQSKSVSRKIDLGQYKRPHGVEFLDNDRVVITAETNQKIAVVNIRSGKVEGEIATQQQATHMVVVDPKSKMAYTANIAPGTVSVLNLKTFELEENIEVGPGIEGIGISPDGAEVWVANRNTNKVVAIDTDTRKITAIMDSPTLPFRVKFSPDGKYALIPNAVSGDISVFDAKTKELVRLVSIKGVELEGTPIQDPGPVGLIADDKSKFLYVNCIQINRVAVIDLNSFEVVDFFKTGNVPDGMAYSPKHFN